MRTVCCCKSHSNDEVMYWTPQTRACMERNVTSGWICIAPLMAKCFPSHHYPFKHKTKQVFILNVSRYFIITMMKKRHLKGGESFENRQKREMDRRKCQHGADKVFEIKGMSLSGEWKENIEESVHEKWQRGTNEKETVCEWYKEGEKMRWWRFITPSDGVADWCCRANAELLRNWSLMDGAFARVMFVLSLICIFVCICGVVGFC